MALPVCANNRHRHKRPLTRDRPNRAIPHGKAVPRLCGSLWLLFDGRKQRRAVAVARANVRASWAHPNGTGENPARWRGFSTVNLAMVDWRVKALRRDCGRAVFRDCLPVSRPRRYLARSSVVVNLAGATAMRKLLYKSGAGIGFALLPTAALAAPEQEQVLTFMTGVIL